MYQFAAGLGTGLFAGLLFGAGLIWCFVCWSDFKKTEFIKTGAKPAFLFLRR
ncbi:hypothetical protein O163_10125 [Caldanaerobacter subterraneus subsp. yonseiensis KB-1]|uniref:Uncharacterized protein n=2 Tax=Caldanaerobacter subterraneus TaxID=911092 RepID=U5CF27_CALSX|nr:hypothetical protein O163_10125 [Caldanaerobacter subterraneus subsp. yonseiensis KB-1]